MLKCASSGVTAGETNGVNASYNSLVSTTKLRYVLAEYIPPAPLSAFDTARTLPVAEDLIGDRIDY
jgi:hypothetical protein